MQYSNIIQGHFISRPNRFIAQVDIDGKKETVHVKNTGRCAELLIPGAVVYVQDSLHKNPSRKTRWDLIAVEKGSLMINMDSQIPNKVVEEWLKKGNLFSNITQIRPEYTYGNSRIDLYVEADGQKILIEVKGVTLETDGVARFPDAPSERAVKHVTELRRAVKDGCEAYVFFVIQMKGVHCFMPNTDTHPQFAEALREAAADGVKIIAYDCKVTKDSIKIADKIPVVLDDMNVVHPDVTDKTYTADMADTSYMLRMADIYTTSDIPDAKAGAGTLWQLRHILPEAVIRWYRKNKRELPWRDTRDAYRIWANA